MIVLRIKKNQTEEGEYTIHRERERERNNMSKQHNREYNTRNKIIITEKVSVNQTNRQLLNH